MITERSNALSRSLRRYTVMLILILPAFGALGGRPAAATARSWRQLIVPGCTTTCPNSPPARGDTAMTYDAATRAVVLFGGLNGQKEFLNDTWSFRGGAWRQVIAPGCVTTCPQSPPARFGAAMVSNGATNTIVLFGGFGLDSTGGCCFALNDTWSFNGNVWAQLAGSIGPDGCGGRAQPCPNSPASRLLSGMVYDSATLTAVLFGGCAVPSFAGCDSTFNDTWSFNGTAWRQVISPGCTTTCLNSPPARFAMGMAFDAAANSAVIFGGSAPSGLVNDTWNFNGTAWTQRISPGCTNACPNSPPARIGPGMDFDTKMGVATVFGGGSPSGLLNDTWSFDGTAWTQLISQGCTSVCRDRPPARSLTNVAYDGARGKLILFGGNGSFSGIDYLNDTWGIP